VVDDGVSRGATSNVRSQASMGELRVSGVKSYVLEMEVEIKLDRLAPLFLRQSCVPEVETGGAPEFVDELEGYKARRKFGARPGDHLLNGLVELGLLSGLQRLQLIAPVMLSMTPTLTAAAPRGHPNCHGFGWSVR